MNHCEEGVNHWPVTSPVASTHLSFEILTVKTTARHLSATTGSAALSSSLASSAGGTRQTLAQPVTSPTARSVSSPERSTPSAIPPHGTFRRGGGTPL